MLSLIVKLQKLINNHLTSICPGQLMFGSETQNGHLTDSNRDQRVDNSHDSSAPLGGTVHC